MKRFGNALKTLLSREDGSQTVEAVLWMPAFAMFLVFTVDVSLLFNSQSTLVRVVQDANRAYSVGRFDTASETEAYVRSAVEAYSTNSVIDTVLKNGVITTRVEIPAADLMPIGNFSAFADKKVVISAQQLAEY